MAQFTFTLSLIHAAFILTLTAVDGVFMSKSMFFLHA